MWHHKAQEEIASRFMECNLVPPAGAPVRPARLSKPNDEIRLLAG
jgi:hypothetical protein